MNKYILIVAGAAFLSTFLGAALGILLHHSICVRERYSVSAASEDFSLPLNEKALPVILNQAAPYLSQAENNERHKFVLGISGGFVAVYCEGSGLVEITDTPVNALSQEEVYRLTNGIYVYTDEQLTKLLQDYCS